MTSKSKKLLGGVSLLGAVTLGVAAFLSSTPIDDKTAMLQTKTWAWPKTEPTIGTCAKTVYLYDPGCKLQATEDRNGEMDDAGKLITEVSVTGDANEALEKAPIGRFPYASLAECWSKEVDVPPIKLDPDCYKILPGSRAEYPFQKGLGWPRGVLSAAWAQSAAVNFDCACGSNAKRSVGGAALRPGEVAKIVDLTLGDGGWYKVPCSEFNLSRETSVLPAQCCVGAGLGMECGDDSCGKSAGTCVDGAQCIGHRCVSLSGPAAGVDAGVSGQAKIGP